jgi:hypothetical protein
MVVGLFVGMAIMVIVLSTANYIELVRVWKDVDALRREVRRMSRELGKWRNEHER